MLRFALDTKSQDWPSLHALARHGLAWFPAVPASEEAEQVGYRLSALNVQVLHRAPEGFLGGPERAGLHPRRVLMKGLM